MKILHVIFSLKVGGAETLLVDIINEQINANHVELIIINSDYDVNLINTIDKRVKVKFFNRLPGSKNIITVLKFNLLLFKINPSIVHFHNHNAINFLKVRFFFKTCLTIHDTKYPLQNIRKYDKLFSISYAVKYDILLRSNCISKVIYNGIPFDQIENYQLIKSPSVFKIVQISRLMHEKKGQHILIRALDIIVNNFGISNIQLDFIGEGDSLVYLMDLVNKLDLELYVNFIGLKSKSNLYKELKNYDLLIQPSLYEGFGLTVVEAMAARIPVLVSNIEGPMEIIDNGGFGYFFNNGDEKDCAEMIVQIINKVRNNEIDEVVDNAYRHALLNFDIVQTALNYTNNY